MIGTSRFVSFYLLLIAAWGYLFFRAAAPVPAGKPLAGFPTTCREWRMTSQSRFSESVMDVLKPTDYLYRSYGGKGKNISLYIGYHDGGKESGEIHSPKHCLPGSGWQEISTARMTLAMPGGDVSLVKAIYRKGESRELFLYWYQVRGETVADEYSLKLTEVSNSIIHRRRDAAFIRISLPLEEDEKGAVATGIAFIRDFYPLIREFLPS